MVIHSLRTDTPLKNGLKGGGEYLLSRDLHNRQDFLAHQ
ncbi:hypothetical protein SAMN04515672_1090 [Natronorubrum texcoconense]|uniref:Uncharacterized protein n=1 Tax=Natronorubrum texcoconense TaxID=1095776 RepID=A0A1G8UYM7_9EURY|nr:hypothetical protein SAMN04515672_1090 [Natronorubrum texcoconense]